MTQSTNNIGTIKLLAQASEQSKDPPPVNIDDSVNEYISTSARSDESGVPADLTILGLDRLLDLPLDIGSGPQHSDSAPDGGSPRFEDDDLTTPSIHPYDLPADLTTVGLSQLLDLKLSGSALPTVGEIVRTIQKTDSDKSDSKTANEGNTDTVNDTEATAPDEVRGPPQQPEDLSFINPQSLVEKAETNNFDFAEEFEDNDAQLFEFGFGGAWSYSDSKYEFNDDFEPAHHPTPSGPMEGDIGADSNGGGINVINGTVGNDVLIGTGAADNLVGFEGNDTLDGGGGTDRLDGGLGDDVLVWDAADANVAGKNGTDTVRVDGGYIDLTTFHGSVSDVEIVDMQSDKGANTLTLTAQNVLDITDGSDTLEVSGNPGDTLDAGSGWSDGGLDGGGNHIYTQTVGSSTATLTVHPDVTPNANILM